LLQRARRKACKLGYKPLDHPLELYCVPLDDEKN
jgi:hypothetical protein